MKLKTLLLPFAALALCTNAFAATPSDASLERLFEVQKMDALLDQSLQSVGGIVLSDPKIQDFLKDVPKDKRTQLEEVLKKYTNQLINEINALQENTQVHKAALDGIKAVYTQEEVNRLIDFYGTAVGAIILTKTPCYFEITMNLILSNIEYHHRKIRKIPVKTKT